MTFEELIRFLPRPVTPRATVLRPGVRYSDQPNPKFIAPTFSIERPFASGRTSTILVSAPAAVGKSTIATELAHLSSAMVWDLAGFQVGTDTFSGTILSCFGDSAPAILAGLTRGDFLLVLDALDEAHVRAGVQNFEAFLEDITRKLKTARAHPALVLFARSETSELIALALELEDVPFARVTVDFFDRERAIAFLERRMRNILRE